MTQEVRAVATLGLWDPITVGMNSYSPNFIFWSPGANLKFDRLNGGVPQGENLGVVQPTF